MATLRYPQAASRDGIVQPVDNMSELFVVQYKVAFPPCIYWGLAMRGGILKHDTALVWYCNIERDAVGFALPRTHQSIIWKGMIWSAPSGDDSAADQRASLLASAMGHWRQGSLAWFHHALQLLAENGLIIRDFSRAWILESQRPLVPVTIESNLVLHSMLDAAGLQDMDCWLLRHITEYLNMKLPNSSVVRTMTATAQGHHKTLEKRLTATRFDVTEEKADILIRWEARSTTAGGGKKFIPVFTWQPKLDLQMKRARLDEHLTRLVAVLPPLDPMHTQSHQSQGLALTSPMGQTGPWSTVALEEQVVNPRQSPKSAEAALLSQVQAALNAMNPQSNPPAFSNPNLKIARGTHRRKPDQGISRRISRSRNPNLVANPKSCPPAIVLPKTTAPIASPSPQPTANPQSPRPTHSQPARRSIQGHRTGVGLGLSSGSGLSSDFGSRPTLVSSTSSSELSNPLPLRSRSSLPGCTNEGSRQVRMGSCSAGSADRGKTDEAQARETNSHLKWGAKRPRGSR